MSATHTPTGGASAGHIASLFLSQLRPSLATARFHGGICTADAATGCIWLVLRCCADRALLSYACRPDSTALSGVDLWLEPGKMTALVGLSGSGKSTLVSLLQRLYDPTGAWRIALPLCWLCWVVAAQCIVLHSA